jgi:glycosyltransferase involved in cell wall biosynthesis
VQGGAELCAYNLAKWLASNGHEVGILTTSPKPDDQMSGETVDGLRVWRVWMPRAYTVFDATSLSGWRKPVWHLQDHFDPRNAALVAAVLDSFRPDFVNVHIIQGIGYNGLRAIGRRRLPAAFTLHDLGLACVKMAMFVDGKECDGLCRTCGLSAKVKMSHIRSVSRIGFISPSRANLDKLSKLQPIEAYPRAHILNANKYPTPTVEHVKSDTTRLLYVGRLHESKGVYLLAEALEPLARIYNVTLTLVGTGPSAVDLEKKYGHHSWMKFTGHVSMQEVANWMAESDLLVVPSIWLENSPGVVIQALGVSLPVMGSDKGGIPELVTNDENGVLVPPGNVAAWRAALQAILEDPSRLDAYRSNARRRLSEFDQDAIGNRIVAFFETVRASPGP